MAKPSPTSSSSLPRLLVVELWGLGDLALAMPFLQAAAEHNAVTLLAKPHAAPLLARFAPAVELVPFIAPWTAFSGKYRLHRWPWPEIARVVRTLRAVQFERGISARADPRDHFLLTLVGVRRRFGFPRGCSRIFLTNPCARPPQLHRAAYWAGLAHALGLSLSTGQSPPTIPSAVDTIRGRIVIHTGAGHPVRIWPVDRFAEIAARLRTTGWEVVLLDDSADDLDQLLVTLSRATHFIGNDSGPGHLAALLGVPTFTIFGSQLPELFAPQHPRAAWIEGRPCPYKPCFDACRFSEPHCIRKIGTDEVWEQVQTWLSPRE